MLLGAIGAVGSLRCSLGPVHRPTAPDPPLAVTRFRDGHLRWLPHGSPFVFGLLLELGLLLEVLLEVLEFLGQSLHLRRFLRGPLLLLALSKFRQRALPVACTQPRLYVTPRDLIQRLHNLVGIVANGR